MYNTYSFAYTYSTHTDATLKQVHLRRAALISSVHLWKEVRIDRCGPQRHELRQRYIYIYMYIYIHIYVYMCICIFIYSEEHAPWSGGADGTARRCRRGGRRRRRSASRRGRSARGCRSSQAGCARLVPKKRQRGARSARVVFF